MDEFLDQPEPVRSSNPHSYPGQGQTMALARRDQFDASPNGRNSLDDDDSGGLLDYWRILRRHTAAWIVFAFLGTLIGFLVTLPQTPVFRARTSVEIVGFNENFLNLKQSNPVSESGASSETLDIQTQIKILQSESLIERVLHDMTVNHPLVSVEPGRVPAWRKLLKLPSPVGNNWQRMVSRASKTLEVKSAEQTRIVEITVDSPDPRLAADFANTLTTEFIEQNLESRWKTTQKTSDWLSHQLDDMRVKLERSEDALQNYARNSGLIFTDEKSNVSEDKLRQLQQELLRTEAERIAKQSRYEIAQSSPPDALPDVINDGGLRELQSKTTELKRQIAELSPTYTTEYAKVKRLQAQMATLESAFEQERASILSRIKDDFNEATRREKLLKDAYDEQTKQVSGEGERSIQYNILKREVDSNRQLYETMLQQLKQSTIAAALRASNIRVVDPAKPASRPFKPTPGQNAAIGCLAGLMIGAALIVMRDRADRTIQQPGDASLYLNMPELGVIPSGKASLLKYASYISSRNVSPVEENARLGTQRVELATYQRRFSPVAESFRSSLISILFATQRGSRPKVFLLTSAGAAEGKSTVASNLAIATAEIGQRVLLIDADMRRPRQHDIFAMENDNGLSNLLKTPVTLNGDKSLGGAIRDSSIPGLSLLTSGSGNAAATSLLYGPHLPKLLAYLREEFDVVLIDTPPMLHVPDARLLGQIVDKVILVIRAGQTTRDAAAAAWKRLRDDGIAPLGTILNDWNPKSAPSGYYGYYNKSAAYTYYTPEINKVEKN